MMPSGHANRPGERQIALCASCAALEVERVARRSVRRASPRSATGWSGAGRAARRAAGNRRRSAGPRALPTRTDAFSRPRSGRRSPGRTAAAPRSPPIRRAVRPYRQVERKRQVRGRAADVPRQMRVLAAMSEMSAAARSTPSSAYRRGVRRRVRCGRPGTGCGGCRVALEHDRRAADPVLPVAVRPSRRLQPAVELAPAEQRGEQAADRPVLGAGQHRHEAGVPSPFALAHTVASSLTRAQRRRMARSRPAVICTGSAGRAIGELSGERIQRAGPRRLSDVRGAVRRQAGGSRDLAVPLPGDTIRKPGKVDRRRDQSGPGAASTRSVKLIRPASRRRWRAARCASRGDPTGRRPPWHAPSPRPGRRSAGPWRPASLHPGRWPGPRTVPARDNEPGKVWIEQRQRVQVGVETQVGLRPSVR